MKSKVALITGITGQDGQHLKGILLEKGYSVFGISHSDSKIKDNEIFHWDFISNIAL